jgi:ABC-2 type transport system permease protein
VRWAGSLTSALLVGNFFLYGMSNINSDLKLFYELTPFYFTQGSDAINNLKVEWLLGLLFCGLLLAAFAWLRFLRRDIRVSGEGGWQLNWFNKGSES